MRLPRGHFIDEQYSGLKPPTEPRVVHESGLRCWPVGIVPPPPPPKAQGPWCRRGRRCTPGRSGRRRGPGASSSRWAARTSGTPPAGCRCPVTAGIRSGARGPGTWDGRGAPMPCRIHMDFGGCRLCGNGVGLIGHLFRKDTGNLLRVAPKKAKMCKPRWAYVSRMQKKTQAKE